MTVSTAPRARRPEPEEARRWPAGILPAIQVVLTILWVWRDRTMTAIAPQDLVRVLAALDEHHGVIAVGATGAVEAQQEALSLIIEALQARGWLTRTHWPIRISEYGLECIPVYLERLARDPRTASAIRTIAAVARQHQADVVVREAAMVTPHVE